MLLLTGTNSALLEGLSQSLARTGSRVLVAETLADADDLRAQHQPVLVVVERTLLARQGNHPFISNAIGAGCALVTYRESSDVPSLAVAPGLSRLILADLVLPLERNRLVALAEHAIQRARAVGRPPDVTRPESSAS